MQSRTIQALAAGLALLAPRSVEGGLLLGSSSITNHAPLLLNTHEGDRHTANAHNADSIVFGNATAPRPHVRRDYGSGKKCSFPSDGGIVAVAANMKNAGWAIAPDIECLAGMYCPYACPPGQVMAQWREGSTYTYPASMVSARRGGGVGKTEKTRTKDM
jgi:hypothetical protein